MFERVKEFGTITFSLVLFTVLWELSVWLFSISEFLLPAPSAVIVTLVLKFGPLMEHCFVTFRETIYGFLMGLVLGVTSAVLIVYSRALQNLLYPLILVAQIVPKVAIAPLLLVWVGYGEASKVLIAFLVSWFPIIVTTVQGMRMVQPEMLDPGQVAAGLGLADLHQGPPAQRAAAVLRRPQDRHHACHHRCHHRRVRRRQQRSRLPGHGRQLRDQYAAHVSRPWSCCRPWGWSSTVSWWCWRCG